MAQEGVAADGDVPRGHVEQCVVEDGGGVDVHPAAVGVDQIVEQFGVVTVGAGTADLVSRPHQRRYRWCQEPAKQSVKHLHRQSDPGG